MTVFAGLFRSSRLPTAAFRHLRAGLFYRIARPFRDFDGREHEAGRLLRFREHHFLPYKDGLTLVFVGTGGDDETIRLQWRAEAQGAVVDALDEHFEPADPPHRSAFAHLRAVGPQGLVAFDGVNLIAFGWPDIRCVRASWGRQQYDETRILTIDHRRGISVFLPENEARWRSFVDAMAAKLPGALEEDDWMRRLAAEPTANVLVWRHTPVSELTNWARNLVR